MKPVATCLATLVVVLAFLCTAQVTTSQYDNARSGATLNEKILTPQNVNAQRFGKLGVFKVDGPVDAQPLFVPNVEIPGKGTLDRGILSPGQRSNAQVGLHVLSRPHLSAPHEVDDYHWKQS